MKTSDQLSLAAAKLSAATGWDQFVAAFRAYRDEQYELMAAAPPDRVHTLQGRAQGANDLLKRMETCREDAAKIEEKLKNARTGP